MTLKDALLSIAVAIAAGILVGAERQQAQHGRQRPDFGGVRTFLIAGGTALLLSQILRGG